MPRVLVADDDPLIRRVLTRCLESGGYDTATASDGPGAIRLLEGGEHFDVLLTDHAMPGATGVEVIAAAHRLDPTLPCLVITAFHDMAVAMAAMAEGAVGFLPKPFKPQHLLLVVDRALERRRLADEAIRLRLLAPLLERFTILLANAIEEKDLGTSLHCERLVRGADSTARRLGVHGEALVHVRMGACLHDVGKISVPADLLRSTQRLDTAGWEVLREHPVVGARILDGVDGWEAVRDIVRHHHERFDGTGYPDGIAAASIPPGARIVSVVDAFDVMRHGRPYAPARTLDAAVAELRRGRGGQFDPDCVDAFLTVLDDDPRSVELLGTAEAPLLLAEE